MTRLALLAAAAPIIQDVDVNLVVLRPDGTDVALDALAVLRTDFVE